MDGDSLSCQLLSVLSLSCQLLFVLSLYTNVPPSFPLTHLMCTRCSLLSAIHLSHEVHLTGTLNFFPGPGMLTYSVLVKLQMDERLRRQETPGQKIQIQHQDTCFSQWNPQNCLSPQNLGLCTHQMRTGDMGWSHSVSLNLYPIQARCRIKRETNFGTRDIQLPFWLSHVVTHFWHLKTSIHTELLWGLDIVLKQSSYWRLKKRLTINQEQLPSMGLEPWTLSRAAMALVQGGFWEIMQRGSSSLHHVWYTNKNLEKSDCWGMCPIGILAEQGCRWATWGLPSPRRFNQ